MPLITEDITITQEDGWTAVVLTGTVIHITEVRNSKCLYRFGIASDSEGTELGIGESITVGETIYVKPIPNLQDFVTITVTKD